MGRLGSATWRSLLLAGIALGYGAGQGSVVAQTAPASVATARSYNILPGPLGSAMVTFGEVSGLRVMALTELVAGRRTTGVSGPRTADAALRELLAGTGLSYRYSDGGTVTLTAAPAVRTGLEAAPIELPAVDVASERSRLRTDQQGPSRGLDGSRVISNTSYLPVPVVELPRTVNVVTPERLEQLQVERPSQYFRDIPTVNFTANGEGVFTTNNITIRGLPAINSLIDGMRTQDAGYGTVGLNGIERVEIFQGPSAALQGGGNLGGTVNFVTKQPLDTPQYRVDVGTGFEKRLNRPMALVGFDATGPLSDTLSYRAIGGLEYRERFQEPALRTDTRGYFNGSLRWRPDGDTSVLANFDYFRGNLSGGLDGVPARGTVLPNPGGFTIPYGRTYANAESTQSPYTELRGRVQADRRLNEVWSLNAGANLGWSDFRYNNLILPGALGANGRTLARSAVNINYLGYEAGGRLNLTGTFQVAGMPNLLVVGYDVNAQRNHAGEFVLGTVRPIDILVPDYSNPLTGQTRSRDFVTTTFRQGLFVNDRLTVLPGVDLYGGVRGDFVEQSSRTYDGGATAHLNDSAPSGNAGVSWAVRPNTRVFFGWSQAFNPQGATAISRQGTPFAPLQGEQYEVGIKQTVTDRLFVQAALFRINESNVLTPDPVNPLFSIAAGEVRSQGVDVSATGEIAPGWSASASYAFLDTVITADNSGNVGKRLSNVPRHSVRLFTAYEFQSGPLQGVGIGGGVRYASNRFADNANSVKLPDYAVFDALAYYKFAKYKIQLNVENLTDRRYFPNGTGVNSVYYGQPLTAYLRLSRTF